MKIAIAMVIEMVVAAWTDQMLNCRQLLQACRFQRSLCRGCTRLWKPSARAKESSREQLRWLNEVAADVSFHDYLSADADTIEVLGDQEILQLVSDAQEEPQDADNPEIAEAAMPAPRKAMDAVDLLRRFCSGS